MTTLSEYRARGAAASDRLDRDVRFLKVSDLARRWGISPTTVRAIPAELLPYVNLGQGLEREARRYRPDDVESYEDAHRHGARAAVG